VLSHFDWLAVLAMIWEPSQTNRETFELGAGPMKRIETGSPDVLEYREPTSWWVLLGLPFGLALLCLGLGVSVMLVIMPVVAFSSNNINAWGVVMAVLLGIVGLSYLASILGTIDQWFFRVGVRVDRRRQTAVKKYGFLFPLPLHRCDLRRYSGMRIIEETTRSRSSISTRYLLYLLDHSGRKVLIGRSESSNEIFRMKDDVQLFLAPPTYARQELVGSSTSAW
jgi:hypothetical protein